MGKYLGKRSRTQLWPAGLGLLLLFAFLAGCGGTGPYAADFSSAETWGTDETPEVVGEVRNGVYDMLVLADSGIFWSTANKNFGDGTYQVEARAVEGPVDNGFGLMFMVDTENDEFYLFEVSSDGFIWIGRCVGGCAEDIIFLVGEGWFESSAVRQGLDVTNVLRVDVAGGRMSFYVNDELVGEAADTTLTSGDIGLAVETYGAGGVRVHFDNFSYIPLPTD